MPSYNPALFAKGARAMFEMGIDSAESFTLNTVATEVPSDSYDEDYAWLPDPPSFSEFVDEVQFQGMSNASYELANKKYTSGIEVYIDDINDAKVRGYDTKLRQLGAKSKHYVDYLNSQSLINGTSTTLGTHIHAGAFFRTDHPARAEEGGTQSNLLTGAGTSVSNIQTDMSAALAKLIELKGEDGHPANMGFRHVVAMFPTALYFKGLEALTAPILSQTSNVRHAGFRIDVEVNPYLDTDSADDWYVGIVDTEIRGLIWQSRETATLVSQDNAESDAAFVREVYRWKAKMRGRAGYGHWWKLIKVNN